VFVEKWMYNEMDLYPLCHFLLILGSTCSFFFNSHCHVQKFISPQSWGSMWCDTYHQKRHDLYYPSTGFLSGCVISFMSIYFDQLWGPKSMTRVVINEKNQYINNLPLWHSWQHSCSPYPHSLGFCPPMASTKKCGDTPPNFNGKM